jgi:hypothetical protein
MSRLMAAALLVLLVAGCSPVAYQTPPDESATPGHVDSGGAGGGAM